MEASSVNELLAGKKIASVELGHTPGWIVVNFDPQEFELCRGEKAVSLTAEEKKDKRVYLTVFVGGRLMQDRESEYHHTAALHVKSIKTSSGILDPIRDGRDEEMPMSWGIAPSEAWDQGNPNPYPKPGVVAGSSEPPSQAKEL